MTRAWIVLLMALLAGCSRHDSALEVRIDMLEQQLAAMTRERDNYLSKWRASADLNKGLLRDYDASQARCREMERGTTSRTGGFLA